MAEDPTHSINRRIVALGDLHYPQNIPLAPVYRFIRAVKPTHLLLVGDMLDLSYLSHWDKNKPRKLEGKRLKADYEGFKPILDEMQDAAAKAETHYFVGNHEAWIDDCLDEGDAGLAEGFVEIENGLEFKRRGIRKINENGYLRIGRLTFMHNGGCHNDFFTKAIVEKYVTNAVVFHHHTRQEYTKVTPIARTDMSCFGIGSLCNKNPDYAAGKPNKWVHGICYVEMDNDGYFQLYNLVIESGRLIWNGQIFK